MLEKCCLPIYGNITNIDLPIDKFDLSTHAGHNELLTFAEKTNAEHIILYHTNYHFFDEPYNEIVIHHPITNLILSQCELHIFFQFQNHN